MEPVGLAVGVAGLAGLFSSCLEAVERFDSYKNFGRDSRSLAIQFEADKHRFEQWGRAVGIENGKLSDSHHPALDDTQKLAIVHKLLASIQDFGSDAVLIDGPLLDEIRSFLHKAEEEMRAGIKRDLRAWLGCPSPNDLYEDSIQKRLDGTCDWILARQTFCNWLTPDNSAAVANVLWINGPAGFGKTILCARLVEILLSRLQTPVAHFFLSSKFEGRDDPFMAIRSWIAEVTIYSEAALDVVWKRRLAQHEQVATRATIIRLFREVLQTVPFCNFVLDGLDECTWLGENRNSRDSVACFLEELRQAISNTTARVLIVSRNEPEIRQGLLRFSGFSEYVISPEDVHADNIAYSKSIVDNKLPNKDKSTRLSVSQKMTERCNGQFQWLKMQESFLRKGRNRKQLEKDIDETPAGLDSLYDRNWERIEGLRDMERKRALSLLRWAAFALRPLTVCEITEAVLINDDCNDLLLDEMPDSIDDDYIESEILGLCGSLIEVQGTLSESLPGSRKIHLAHFSVKEYLLYRISLQGSVFLANENLRASYEAVESTTLAKLCLRYIGFHSVWDDSLTGEKDQIGISFRNYAAEYWYQHTGMSKTADKTLVEAINAFFDGQVRTWQSWIQWFDANNEDLQAEATEPVMPASPLYYASRLGLTGVVKHLIQDCKHDPNENLGSEKIALGAACGRGNLEVAQMLLEVGANVNITGHRGQTPLYTAAKIGHLEVVKLLLDRGADITVTNNYGWTPINTAANNGHLEVVKLLLNKGADITVADDDGWTPLQAAADSGHLEVVKLLLNKGADITVADDDGWTPLHAAADSGHLEVVKLLLNKGAGITVTDDDGWTPLNAAASKGHLEVVKLLLDKGADITVTNNYGLAPLNTAASNGHHEVVKLLLDKEADVAVASNDDGCTPLYEAASHGHLEVVKLLLDKGADITVTNSDGWTPLNAAAENGHLEVVKLLIKKGADATVANNYGLTPLLTSVNCGHTELVSLLLDKSANTIVSSNGNSWTPLIIAAYKGHLEMVKLLIDKGADITVANANRLTPLEMAISNNQLEVIKLLLDKGANITIANNYGWTPLGIAADRGYPDVVKLLLDKGVNITVANNKSKLTPLIRAAYGGHLEIVKVLLDNGADITVANNGWTSLNAASGNGHAEVVKLLLEKGADVTAANNDGRTPLFTAADGGHLEVVKLLLDKGADIAIANKSGWTPFMTASRRGYFEVAGWFLKESQVNIDDKDNNDRTPLFYAAMEGRNEIVRLLLVNKASVNAKDRYNATPLIAASRNGHGSAVEILLEAENICLDCKDDIGLTALCWARKRGNTHVIQLLLQHSDEMGVEGSYEGCEDARTANEVTLLDQSSVWCDVCTTFILVGKTYHECELCDGGHFCVCLECFGIGFRCRDDSHELVLQKAE
ncbi:hypothetical protein EsH8_X_000636 [Colletotrichum jinshuiense]